MLTTDAVQYDPLSEPTAHRVAMLNRDDRLFHIILAQQFDCELIETMCRLAEMIRNIAESKQGNRFLRSLLSHKRAMLYFIQPSTRTFLSFAASCQILGIPYNEVRNPSTSSEMKGETEDDTVHVLSQYFDLIIMRHPVEGFAERMAYKLNGMPRPIPILNGGSGKDQHPTQAMLDIYTLLRNFEPRLADRAHPTLSGNPFAGKTIAFVGDLKRGRTVRSLSYLLAQYAGMRLIFVSPPELGMGEDIIDYLDRHGVHHEQCEDLNEVIRSCDAVYMTRLQDEYDQAGESSHIDYYKYSLTVEMVESAKDSLVIMHPLPRRQELDVRLDTDARAKYWAQVRNGMWMRAAMIAYIFNVDATIIDHYKSTYTA